VALTSLRLVDGSREMVLHPRTDFFLTGMDVPLPAVRAVAEDRTDDDGSRDSTARHGARAASLEFRAFDTPMALVDELTSYLHPAARPYLHMADDEWGGERRLQLRVDQFSGPMSRTSHVYRDVQAQWVAPDGIWEAVEPVSFTVNADTGELTGRTYPLTFPRTYPVTTAAGALEHTNLGSTWAHFTARLYGPCNGPRLTNDTTGESLVFTEDLVVAAGEYVEIDTQDRTALYLSQAGASRLNQVDFAASSWWRLARGVNRLRYHPVSGVEAGCAAVGEYHPVWL
jgi:hypothetical protein